MEHSSIPHVQEGMIVVHSLLIPYSINESTSILIKIKRYKLSLKDSKLKLSFTLTLETKGIFDWDFKLLWTSDAKESCIPSHEEDCEKYIQT